MQIFLYTKILTYKSTKVNIKEEFFAKTKAVSKRDSLKFKPDKLQVKISLIQQST